MPTSKPKWRNKLDNDEIPRPTTAEYWDQVSRYAKLAFEIVRVDPDKLAELIDSLDRLPEAAFTEVLAHLESEAVTSLPDEERLPIWAKLTSFARKHRAHADAQWALPPEAVGKIERAASSVAPTDPFVAHRILFSRNTWDLHDDPTDWRKNEERLAERQRNAVEEIYKIGGFEAVKKFAASVEEPGRVGFGFGELEKIEVTNRLLPTYISSSEPQLRLLARGIVWALWQRGQWAWFDSLDTSAWTPEQISQLLIYLRFEPETWKRADQRLGAGATEYWTRFPVDGLIRGDQDCIAVDAFMAVNRPRAAVACLAGRVFDKQPIDPVRAVDALLAAVNSKEFGTKLDPYHTATVIKALQEDRATDKAKLIAVEWAYLAWLKDSPVTGARTLNASIAESPEWFCEIVRMIFRSDFERTDEERSEPPAEQRALAENAYRLLEGWNTVPGTQPDGSISADVLREWIDKVHTSLRDSGHLEVGLQKAGEVFLHAPADPDGLFIHRAVAEILNRDDMDEFRRGYELAVINSRGVHFVDPTGAPEIELAKTYSEKADAVENAGFHRLAVTLRSISESYKREAERNVARHEAEKSAQESE
jgi:hypothetical protein